jgi:hypothetical protein
VGWCRCDDDGFEMTMSDGWREVAWLSSAVARARSVKARALIGLSMAVLDCRMLVVVATVDVL